MLKPLSLHIGISFPPMRKGTTRVPFGNADSSKNETCESFSEFGGSVQTPPVVCKDRGGNPHGAARSFQRSVLPAPPSAHEESASDSHEHDHDSESGDERERQA